MKRYLPLLVLCLLLSLLISGSQAAGPCSIYRTWNTGDSLSASDLNSSFTTVGVTNMIPSCVDDYSATESQMQTTTDPYPSSAVSLPTSLQGELERLRYVMKKITGWSQWYAHTESLNALVSRGHLYGLTLSNNAGDATNDIDIAIGQAADSTGAQFIALGTALTKQLDATWAVGTNQGFRDGGTIANASYHVYVIKRSDTSVVDVLASLNNDATTTITMTIASPAVVTWTDHGLQAGSSVVFTTTGALPTGVTASTRYYVLSTSLGTSTFQFSASEGGSAVNTSGSQSGTHTGTAGPIMPASYDFKRRIGSLVRSSGAILAFIQNGDYFQWTATPINNWGVSNPGTSAVTRTLTVPVGIKMTAQVMVSLETATGDNSYGLLSDLAATDVAPTISLSNHGGTGTANGFAYNTELMVRTSPAAQIRSRISASDASVQYYGSTRGWIDRRNRDN